MNLIFAWIMQQVCGWIICLSKLCSEARQKGVPLPPCSINSPPFSFFSLCKPSRIFSTNPKDDDFCWSYLCQQIFHESKLDSSFYFRDFICRHLKFFPDIASILKFLFSPLHCNCECVPVPLPVILSPNWGAECNWTRRLIKWKIIGYLHVPLLKIKDN